MLSRIKHTWEESLRWVEQHSWGLIVAYFLFFITSYGILWNLIEPLSLNLNGFIFLLLVAFIAAHLTLLLEVFIRRRRTYIRLREEFWEEIKKRISQANSKVVFIGGISSSLLNSNFYSLITEKLTNSSQLTIKFFYESSDNLFRRSQYCEVPLQQADQRDFSGMLKRKLDIEKIPEEVRKRISHIEPKIQQNILSRLSVKEVHLQLYMIVTKIDDIIYLTSISNRRNSRSPTVRLADKRDPFYRMAVEYINYFTEENPGEPYSTDPGEEILQIFDEKGIARGFCARATVRKIPRLRVKVVFGFVFDEDGNILLQKRSNKARDNQLLWDKSFGGHMNGEQDPSIIETARREFSEELLNGQNQQVNLYHLGQWNSQTLDYSNEFKLGKFLLFNLYDDPIYESIRITTENGIEKEIKLAFNVTAFVVFCPDKKMIRHSPDVENYSWVSLSDLKIRINHKKRTYTPDLMKVISTKGAYLEQVSRVIKSSKLSG